MCPHGYYNLMRESKDPRLLRLRMVMEARRGGIKPAARLFRVQVNTVRKWLRRYDGTLESLADHSRAPKGRPRKLSRAAEERIVRARRKLPMWGAERLRRDLDLPWSANAIARVLRERGLLRKWRRRKPQVKRCLREIKRNWPLWSQIEIDTKHLYDMPEYLVQMKLRGLPRFQYTAREVSTGALFLGYADELSLTYAELFARRIIGHLKGHGVDMTQVTCQTDNGAEFVGSWLSRDDSAFTQVWTSAKARHRTIPPGQHRYQADVETVHSLMETEFYLERFADRGDFMAKAETYQAFFNYARPNSGKEYKTPWELVREKNSTASVHLLNLPPAYLPDLHRQLAATPGGHDVWVHP
jgi:transposase